MRLEIDLNSRDGNGHTLVRHTMHPELQPGDKVMVYQPDDMVSTTARVVSVDAEHDIVRLDVDWDGLGEM